MLWMSGGDEQHLQDHDFEGAISMYAGPVQLSRKTMLTNVMPNMRRSVVAASGKKGKLKETGLSSVEDDVVRNNLEGSSRFMSKKGWVDPQGRQGKGFGVYRFANKYGGNIDRYSPIYRPDDWSDTGDTFSLGTKGLIAWAGLVVVLLGVGGTLIVQTSQLS